MAAASNTVTKRPRKSAAEKAQLDLDAAIKRRDAAQAKLDKAEPAVITLRTEVEEATTLVNYLAANPLLQTAAPEDSPSGAPDGEDGGDVNLPA